MDCKSFLKLAVASGLLKSADALKMEQDLARLVKRKATEAERLKLMMAHLVHRNLLTPWQCVKLSQGTYKGFFMGRYKFLKAVSRSEGVSRYLMEDTESGETLEMTVSQVQGGVLLSVLRDGSVVETAVVERQEG